MATDESNFKSQFKKDLKESYPEALIWTNTDMFRAGLPDMSALFEKSFYGIEIKFVSKLPKKLDSKCLKHEVTPAQISFLEKAKETGNYGCVVIGLPDVALLMREIKANYELGELLHAERIEREKGRWNTTGFFGKVRWHRG